MKFSWLKVVSVTSVLLFMVWMVGLGVTFLDYFDPPTSNADIESPERSSDIPETEEGEGVHVLALGDSLTRGIGDPKGIGYIGYLVEKLKERSEKDILLHNYGISGQTSDELVELVKQNEIQRQIKQADYILITIGGNDLFQSGQTLMELDIQAVEGIEAEYIKNINQVLSDMRGLNSEAEIFLIGLYNPFINFSDAETTSKVVIDWNYKSAVEVAKFEKAVFVPTYDLFQLKMDDYLYTDQFHPNAEGYQLIAERVASLITW